MRHINVLRRTPAVTCWEAQKNPYVSMASGMTCRVVVRARGGNKEPRAKMKAVPGPVPNLALHVLPILGPPLVYIPWKYHILVQSPVPDHSLFAIPVPVRAAGSDDYTPADGTGHRTSWVACGFSPIRRIAWEAEARVVLRTYDRLCQKASYRP